MTIYRIKFLFLLMTALLALAMHMHAEEKTFTVTRGGRLEVRLDVGDIKVESGVNDRITVNADKGLSYDLSGNTLTIKTDGMYRGSAVKVKVPSEFNIQLKTNAGNIEFNGTLTGTCSAITSGGDIKVKNINGLTELSTSGGKISAGDIKGNASIKAGGGDIITGSVDGELTIKTGGGNISVENVGKSLVLTTGGGNIKVREISGTASVKTGGGNVYMDKVFGSSIITTGGGDIKLNYAKGEIKAKTGSGNIIISGLHSKYNIYTGSGDLNITLLNGFSGTGYMKTSYGDITLGIQNNVKANISAKLLSWNSGDDDNLLEDISSDFKEATVDKRGDNHELIATYVINGGGNNLIVENAYGEIHIRKK